MNNPSENLKNLFEMPVLFYALCLYLGLGGQADSLDLLLAWSFAVTRVLHSVIQCTVNRVLVRFYVYLVSSLALWALFLRTAWRYLGES